MTKKLIQRDLKSRFLVSSADVDFQANLKPGALINFLIQSAWQHAETIGWGVNDLLKHNLAWVLSGLKIQIDSYPKWKEEVEILTWPKGINRLFYLRDFTMFDAGGNEIGRATSSWLLIDIKTRRPKMLPMDTDIFSLNLNRHAIDEVIPTLMFEHSDFSSNESVIRYSDIDVNHHLTATRYIDLMLDMFEPDLFKKQMPAELTINFMKEVVYGQKVIMQSHRTTEKEYQFRLITKEKDKPHFMGKIAFGDV